MPKRNCTHRAEWRLQTGKSGQSISAHYRLECDYGTPVILLWQKGGSEPVYVCDGHAKQLGPSRDHGPDARILTADSEQKDNPIQSEDPGRTAAPVDAKSKKADSPKIVQTPVAVHIGSAVPAEPAATKSKDTDSSTIAQTPQAAKIESTPPALPAEAKAKDSDFPKPLPTPPAARPGRAGTDAPARSRVRDLTFGDSAKAMVDEAIWNLATGDFEVYRAALQQGKSAREAAQAAGGQLAVIHQKAGEYALKLEELLSVSNATISVEAIIDKPLEQSVLEIISNGAMGDAEQDAAIQRLGAVQEWVKHGVLGDMTLLQANRILLAIGERLNWGGACDVSEECRPVYRTLYGNLKTAIRTAVPDVQNLHDRLTNLYAAKSELDKELQPAKEFSAANR